MIREYFAQRKAKKVLGKYVTPEALAAISSGGGSEHPPFTAARIEFVLAFVDGKTPEEISERVSIVTEIAMSHDGTVHDIIGALVVVAFGTARHCSPIAGKRAALVEDLSRELLSHLKIVHGAADGHFGNIGRGVRFSYSFILPSFDAILGKVSQLAFGQIEEFVK